MAIDKDTVRYIANLSRIGLRADEVDTFVKQISTILEYVNKLSALNTEDIQPTSHAFNITNVFRDDIRKASLPVDEVLANAPEKRDNFFVVPKIIK